jgi:alpha-tubulin suppressor-like RCC1 family protein
MAALGSGVALASACGGTASVAPGSAGADVTLASGFSHTCFVASDGTVRCWGDDSYGQLGDGSTSEPMSVVTVNDLSGARSLAAANLHTCALLADGTVKCWGNVCYGEDKDPCPPPNLVPTTIAGVSGVQTLAAGGGTTCGILRDGTVRCWGANDSGQLGDGTTNDSWLTAVAVQQVRNAIGIAVGGSHACALLSDGTIACWGSNAVGELGVASPSASSAPIVVPDVSGAIAVTAGLEYTCVLGAAGAIQCWGDDSQSQLGSPATPTPSPPVEVPGLAGARAVSGYGTRTCAIEAMGVTCWGEDAVWGLDTSGPTPVDGFAAAPTAIAIGADHGCALTGPDAVACWGNNSYAQLGGGTSAFSLTPVPVPGL